MFIIQIIQFFLVLSVLILVHEAGHFFVAKKAGVKVEEFGFGIPPRIWGKKIGETIYSINWLPFGGFVRLHGENSEDGVTEPKRAFVNKSKKARTAVITAGVIMNFLLAIVLFSITYSVTGIPRQTDNVRILEVDEGSPAAEATLQADDYIRQVNGNNVAGTEGFLEAVDSADGELELLVERNGENLELAMTPRENPPEGEGPLGVVVTSTETYFPPWWQRPFFGAYYGIQEAVFWGGAVIGGFAMLFSNLFSGTVPADIAGPVGIYAITTEAASFGFLSLINFVAILSVNLAILNIIPFPALDGGRLLFIGIEALFGKKVLPKIENAFHTAGMALLILLLIVITVGDVRKLIEAGSIKAFIVRFAP